MALWFFYLKEEPEDQSEILAKPTPSLYCKIWKAMHITPFCKQLTKAQLLNKYHLKTYVLFDTVSGDSIQQAKLSIRARCLFKGLWLWKTRNKRWGTFTYRGSPCPYKDPGYPSGLSMDVLWLRHSSPTSVLTPLCLCSRCYPWLIQCYWFAISYYNLDTWCLGQGVSSKNRTGLCKKDL